jgi:hypothetical protein
MYRWHRSQTACQTSAGRAATWLRAVASDPARSSSRTTEAWPPTAARCSAVLPACSSAGREVHPYGTPSQMLVAGLVSEQTGSDAGE